MTWVKQVASTLITWLTPSSTGGISTDNFLLIDTQYVFLIDSTYKFIIDTGVSSVSWNKVTPSSGISWSKVN